MEQKPQASTKQRGFIRIMTLSYCEWSELLHVYCSFQSDWCWVIGELCVVAPCWTSFATSMQMAAAWGWRSRVAPTCMAMIPNPAFRSDLQPKPKREKVQNCHVSAVTESLHPCNAFVCWSSCFNSSSSLDDDFRDELTAEVLPDSSTIEVTLVTPHSLQPFLTHLLICFENDKSVLAQPLWVCKQVTHGQPIHC